MTTLNYEGRPRQIVRQLGRFERIPNLCTACLLGQEVKPLYLNESDPETEAALEAERSDAITMAKKKGAEASGKVNAERCHAKFAPHIETIKRMRSEGKVFIEIANAIGMKRQTVYGYYWRNKEMFE